MDIPTDSIVQRGIMARYDLVERRQGVIREIAPIRLNMRRTSTSTESELDERPTSINPVHGAPVGYAPPAAAPSLPADVYIDATPIEVWEGEVRSVDTSAGIMHVVLDSKIGQNPKHTAEIELDEVSEQDRDLIRPGAVFYYTIFKRTIPSVENAQELRFRRLPAWSSAQLAAINSESDRLQGNIRAAPTAP